MTSTNISLVTIYKLHQGAVGRLASAFSAITRSLLCSGVNHNQYLQYLLTKVWHQFNVRFTC